MMGEKIINKDNTRSIQFTRFFCKLEPVKVIKETNTKVSQSRNEHRKSTEVHFLYIFQFLPDRTSTVYHDGAIINLRSSICD